MEIEIVGCGKIGTMLAKGFAKDHSLLLKDVNKEKIAQLEKELGIKKAQKPEVIFLAIKPQDFPGLELDANGRIIISALSGITLEQLQKKWPQSFIYRIMPNLAGEFGQGVTGITSKDKEHKPKVELLMKPFGMYLWLEEKRFDALAALTGSGPAFVSVIIEAMVDAGIYMGFSTDEALPLVLQMIKGTVATLENNKKHPAQLKWEVSSPGGTTIAGIKALEDGHLRSTIINTFLATKKRTEELH